MGAAKRFTQNPGNNAICYYRYSSDSQRDVSIDQQRKAAQDYAAAHGYHIIKEYNDAAISGTREDRPDFQLMLYEVEKLRPAVLILWKTDRLSRDKIDAVMAKQHLRNCGVKIVYVAEAIPDDDEATQILMESLYEAMAASFIISHRKNVVRGQRYNAENALYNGIRVLGYTGKPNQKYEIDEKTAPIVRRIFKEYADGVPLQQICNGLNESGLKTINGNKFVVNSLRRILTNRSYIGEYRYSDIFIKDGMPRLIEDGVFEAVQQRLQANKCGGKGAVKKLYPESSIGDYWLSGKLTCGLCGETIQGMSGTSKTGNPYYYYSCKSHRKHRCTLNNQRKELIEKIVNHTLDELIRHPTLRVILSAICYRYFMEQNDDGGAYEASLKVQLKDVEEKLGNIMKAVESGIFNDTTAKRMKELEEQKSCLKDALLAEQYRMQCKLEWKQVLRFLDSFIGDINNPETRRKLLDILIDKIYVYPDKLMIVCFFIEDNRRELMFEETLQMLENQQKIMDLLYDPDPKGIVPQSMLEGLLGTNENSAAFFQ